MQKLKEITATFLGKDGSYGFHTGEQYDLWMFRDQKNRICISPRDMDAIAIPYDTQNAFNKNWLVGILVKNNKVHLCDSCCKHIADCDADNILFGDNTGYDNVCCCASYEPLLERDHDRGGYK